MRAIIAGFGYLGHKIAEKLTEATYGVTAVRRGGSSNLLTEHPDIQFAMCDLSAEKPELESNEFDLAVFCLAPKQRDLDQYQRIYCDAQSRFLEAVRPTRYVYISSTAVYPELAGTYTENDGSPHSDRAIVLLKAEGIALAQKNATVLRLAGLYSAERPIYGKSNSAYLEDKLIHFIHRDDAALAVAHAVKQALQGIYNVHDGNPQLRSKILRALNFEIGPTAITEQRRISAAKFLATDFKPQYTSYLSGIGLQC